MLVASHSVEENLDVIEDFGLGLSPYWVNPLFDLSALQAAEERLSQRVITAVTPTTHAGSQTVIFAPSIEFVTAKYAAAFLRIPRSLVVRMSSALDLNPATYFIRCIPWLQIIFEITICLQILMEASFIVAWISLKIIITNRKKIPINVDDHDEWYR